MSRKRRNTSSPEPDDSPPAKRRPSPTLYQEDVVDTKEQPHLHVDHGQANAFPGLGAEDEPFYGPALDGIDYLRMVRSEAKGVPNLLSASIEAEATEQHAETHEEGNYFDGVYTARSTVTNGDATIPPAQARYYETLLAQFRVVQATLRCTPPLEAVQALGDTRPISFPTKSATARRAWERHILRHNPHPVQIACMDVESVFELVQLLRKLLRQLESFSEDMKRRLGAWVWASIGKMPDRGELGADEIARMRELASTAANVLKGGNEDQGGDSDEEDEDEDGLGEISTLIEAAVEAGAVDDSSSAKQERDEVDFKSTSALLDMILTVIGEVYGQLDLLEFRPKMGYCTRWIDKPLAPLAKS